MPPKKPPPWLDKNPTVLSEGASWYIKGPPPLHRVYRGGVIYETPYTVSPDEPEVPVSTSGITETFPAISRQYVYKYDTAYPPGGAVQRNSNLGALDLLYTQRYYRAVYSQFWIYNTLLKFDTSTLPDSATIQSAVLKVNVKQTGNTDIRNYRGEYYVFAGTDADYTSDGSTGTTAFDVLLSSVHTGNNNLVLTNLGSISTTGITGFRLHITGGSPTGDNNVAIDIFPVLSVTYT